MAGHGCTGRLCHRGLTLYALYHAQGPKDTELSRDFTFIDDIVAGVIASLVKSKPSVKGKAQYKAREALCMRLMFAYLLSHLDPYMTSPQRQQIQS